MILRIRNEKGEWVSIPAIKGEPGKDGTLKFEELTEEEKASLKGADGKDGAPGKDGVDGKDGYTPIKGVDYFDGAPGKDGKDGVNGVDGRDGVDGKDYILTDADKQEIAAMIEGGNVDLSDYYTKEEIDGLLANLPAGDIPSGEEVEF